MNDVCVKDLIVCTKSRRGNGTEKHSPIRVVTEIFSLDGELIADSDPCGDITPEAILNFLEWHYKDIPTEVHTRRVFEYFIETDD